MLDYNRFLVSLYQAAREVPLEDFQNYALDLLKLLVPFDAARWGTGSADNRGASLHAPHLFNDSPETLTDYNEVREHDTAATFVIANPGVTLNCRLALFYGPANSGLLAYIRRHRHEQALITTHFNPKAGLYQSLSMYGAHENRPFTEQQRQLTELIFPHLEEALRINRALYVERVRAGSETNAWAVAICNAAGYFCFAEPRFIMLLQNEFEDSGHQRLPQALIRSVLDEQPAMVKGQRVVFASRIVGSATFVKARPRLSIDGLSRRELEIANLVASGLTHKEIARTLNIAPTTVRNHLQAIHDRADVRNNADLATQLKQVSF